MNATDQPYMLDTTEFNYLLDVKIPASSFAGLRLLVTGIQVAELRATKNASRRECLLAVFEQVGPTVELASSFAFDIEGAGFDQAYWNDGSGTVERMLKRLQELDPSSKDPRNQWRDILIAETAIKNDAILLSHDENLRKVVCEFGGQSWALSPQEIAEKET
jgi:predicted nucleic acid-binding protein